MSEIDFKGIGKTLRLRRRKKGLTLETIASYVGVSFNYISELERGDKKKVPSDEILVKLAEILSIDEKEIFEGFGKLPNSLVQELEQNEMLLTTLYEIKNNPNLTDIDRNALYIEIRKLYLKHLRK
ncbi:helix-turn-helix transcriptional regulator [Bacillus thuringiensis]|uniref:helix-turn-helix domain-containing protein n=1 Tax=Bacillus cereus group TaxID=86661 RepID=UPI000CD980D6|nr:MULTISPECIES: helix-turn-helix transcriptional regulator [Bacillus cereus group]MEC3417054.1 helix-turn-helix transcriptional regulator [Bacillus cereus]MEC3596958.1 helix-turn-helix transcriptional regulator [Bacillus thuringiensis]MED1574307.1 helix-turn-helix transcriptional regulator [Bacillus paranthracis]MED1836231.1 helix-turn-helix transcriptional regulator [Bacillus thuringiensis]MED2670209.1 helix-turn-helix transcriptional regulator [Bacillus thuringiensis]